MAFPFIDSIYLSRDEMRIKKIVLAVSVANQFYAICSSVASL
jgi:hypothetical protein